MKMSQKFKDYLGAFIIGMGIMYSSFIGYGSIKGDINKKTARLEKIAEEIEHREKNFSEIHLKISKQEIEEIDKENKTPKEALLTVRSKSSFRHHRLGEAILKGFPGKSNSNRWYSLQEMLSLKGGVCIDGAIGFCGLLSDNPEYECKIMLVNYREVPWIRSSTRQLVDDFCAAWGTPIESACKTEAKLYAERFKLKQSLDNFCNKLPEPIMEACRKEVSDLLEEPHKHAVATFKENGKYGFASFNDGNQGGDAVFEENKETDFLEFIVNNFSAYDSYAIIKMDPKTMKFGKAIDGNDYEEGIKWHKIREIKLKKKDTEKLKVEK